MHAATAAVGVARHPAIELGNQFSRMHSLRQRVAVPAMSTKNDIVAPQMSANAGCDRFFADVGMTGPVNEPALVRSGQLLFALPDELHLAVQAKQPGLVKPGERWSTFLTL